MRITVDIYTLKVSDRELWDLVFCIKSRLLESVEHCAFNSGMDTLRSNHESLLQMLEGMVNRLGRPEEYKFIIEQVEEEINKRQKAMGKAMGKDV